MYWSALSKGSPSQGGHSATLQSFRNASKVEEEAGAERWAESIKGVKGCGHQDWHTELCVAQLKR